MGVGEEIADEFGRVLYRMLCGRSYRAEMVECGVLAAHGGAGGHRVALLAGVDPFATSDLFSMFADAAEDLGIVLPDGSDSWPSWRAERTAYRTYGRLLELAEEYEDLQRFALDRARRSPGAEAFIRYFEHPGLDYGAWMESLEDKAVELGAMRSKESARAITAVIRLHRAVAYTRPTESSIDFAREQLGLLD